jgi:hypothetical protein
MVKRKKTRPAKNPQRETLVQSLYQDTQKQRRAMISPLPDEEMNEGLEQLSALVTNIASAPAETTTDIRLKMEILCARLREHLHPEISGEVLDYLLAESIRDDLDVMAIPPAKS